MSVLFSSVVVGLLSSTPSFQYVPELSAVAPTDGELPANGRVFFQWWSDAPSAVSAFVDDETATATWVERVHLESGWRLFAMQVDDLEPGQVVGFSGRDVWREVTWSVVDDDVDPPVFADDEVLFTEVGLQQRNLAGGHVACSPWASGDCLYDIEIEAPSADDDTGVVYYRFENQDGDVLGHSGSRRYLYGAERGSRTICVRAVAVDVAGNESATDVACHDIVEEGGCSHVTASDDGVPLGGLALLVLLRLRRRRGGR